MQSLSARHVLPEQREPLDDLLKSLPARSPSSSGAPERSVKEVLFTPVESGACLVKGEGTLEMSENGLKFSHFPCVLCPGSMCWGLSSSCFINRVGGGRKLTPCEQLSSLTCPRFTNLLPPFLFWSHPLASGTVKSWLALESSLFGLNKQLNEVLFSCFCSELEEGELQC